jgi:MFS family permease
MYFVLPSVLVLPFVLTGLFLYQAALAQSKGWAIEWIAAAFSVFAVVRALTSLAIGPVIDRYSATRLLPLYMLPLGAGLVVVIVGSTPLTAFAYMVLAGISAGSSGSVASAVWAELYGAANVGRARGLAASFAVFATAASPALMGWMFSARVRIEQMLAGAAWMILAAGVVSLPVSPLVQDVRVRMKDPLSVARRLSLRGISPGFD